MSEWPDVIDVYGRALNAKVLQEIVVGNVAFRAGFLLEAPR